MSAISKQSAGDIEKVGQLITCGVPIHSIVSSWLVLVTVISLVAQVYVPKT
jgi:hypothetical protein